MAMIKIVTCLECTDCSSSRTPTPDSFDVAFDYFCSKKNNKIIAGYVGPFDKMSSVPEWCPKKMRSQEEILEVYQKFADKFDVKQALLNLIEDQQMFKENEKSKAICERCKKVVVTTIKKTNYMIPGTKKIVSDILLGFCDECQDLVSIPHESALQISNFIFPKDIENRILAIESKLGGVPGTIISRTLTKESWTVAFGSISQPKKFFSGATIKEALLKAEKEFLTSEYV